MKKSKNGQRVNDPQKPRFPLGKFFAWKSSDVTHAGVEIIVSGYLMLYCTDFLGVSAITVGVILLIANIIDAITDLLVGFLIDSTHTKLGKGRPYELGIIGVTLCTILMFSCPGEASQGVKIAWIFFMYNFIYGVFHTMRGGAQTTYLIRAFSNDSRTIGKVMSYGGIVTSIGGMVVSISFPLLMKRLATSAAGWSALVAIYLIPLGLIGLLRFLIVKEDPSIDAGQQQVRISLKDVGQLLVRNKYLWVYSGMVIIFNAVKNISVQAHYFRYIVGNTSLLSVISVMGTLLLPAMFFMPGLLKRWGPAKVMMGGALLGIAGYLLNFVAGSNMALLMVAVVMTSAANLPMAYLGSLIIMNLANYNEHIGLPRLEACTNQIGYNISMQLGQGIGGFLLGVLLDLSGYISSEAAEVVQPDGALTMIRILYSLVPAVMIAVLALLGNRLSKLDKEMPEIEKAAKERRTAAEPAEAN